MMTTYSYNGGSNYISKRNTHLDSLGNSSLIQTWRFEYDQWGNTVIEELLSPEGAVVLTNSLTYDVNRNITSQVRDDYYRWEFDYNLDGTVSKRREYSKLDGSFSCEKFTAYDYNGKGELISEIKKSPLDSVTELNRKKYLYDSLSNLVEIRETRTSWTRSIDTTLVTRYTGFQTILEYDNRCNLIRKLLFRTGDLYPYRCYFYEYTY